MIAVPSWLAAVFALVAVFQSVPWVFLAYMMWLDRRAWREPDRAPEIHAMDELRDEIISGEWVTGLPSVPSARAFPGGTAYALQPRDPTNLSD